MLIFEKMIVVKEVNTAGDVENICAGIVASDEVSDYSYEPSENAAEGGGEFDGLGELAEDLL